MATERPTPKYDQTLKRIFTHAHDEVIALLGLSARWQGERSPEVPAKLRQADLVWEVTDTQGILTLLHIELQVKIEPDMSQRVAEYALRLHIKYELPVWSAVIYLKPGNNIPSAPLEWDALGRPAMRYDYEVIRLWEVPLEQVSKTPHPWLWPLAGLLAEATPETTGETLDRLDATDLPQDERRELEQSTILLATLRFPWEAIMFNLRRNPMLDEILAESSLLPYLQQQAELQGRAEGEAHGLRKGVQTALIARFGALDTATEAAIDRASRDACLAVLANLMTETLEQARARLLADPETEPEKEDKEIPSGVEPPQK